MGFSLSPVKAIVFGLTGTLASGSLLPSGVINIPSNGSLSDIQSPSPNASAFAANIPSNPIFLSADSVSTGEAKAVCNATMLGSGLKAFSCWNILSFIENDSAPMTFGDRGHGFDVQLPRRLSSPDGYCVIDVFHKDGVISDIANWRQIREAARAVFGACLTESEMYSGGYIRDVGNAKNLAIAVSPFEPRVSCSGQADASPTERQALLDALPQSFDFRNFGPRGMRGVDVALPRTFPIPPSPFGPSPYNISAEVLIAGQQIVQARWFDLWAGAVAVDVMCLRIAKAGIFHLKDGLGIMINRAGTDATASS